MVTPAPPPLGYSYAPGASPQPPTTNRLAIASLVLGVVWLMAIGSILALIFGYIARKEIDQSGGTQQGRGEATAGIVLGYIGLGWVVLALVVQLVPGPAPDSVGLGLTLGHRA